MTNEIAIYTKLTEALAEGSSSVTQTALAVLLGSLAAILTTKYIRPPGRGMRLIYLLFLPGWWFLYQILKAGDKIARSNLGARFTNSPEDLRAAAVEMNSLYFEQLAHFSHAMKLFTAWLIIYLVWWIFTDSHNSKNKAELK